MTLFHAFAAPHVRLPVAGVDEAGRGPWAGPVVAAAVIWKQGAVIPAGIQDSKKLTAQQRGSLFEDIQQHAHFSIAQASVEEIDTLNILQATMLAMRRAVEGLPQPPKEAWIDGNKIPAGLPCPARAWVKGDSLYSEIAAASILAKVTRDTLMQSLHQCHPHYGWHTNAGYGTPAHMKGLEQFGLTPHHRRSYKPIQAFIKASAA